MEKQPSFLKQLKDSITRKNSSVTTNLYTLILTHTTTSALLALLFFANGVSCRLFLIYP